MDTGLPGTGSRLHTYATHSLVVVVVMVAAAGGHWLAQFCLISVNATGQNGLAGLQLIYTCDSYDLSLWERFRHYHC